MMETYSRVTIAGDRRRADVVLPSREPIGQLMPEMLKLIGDNAQSPPRLRRLVTPDGDVLDLARSLSEAGIMDGAVLTMVRADEIPSAPVIHDVVEETSRDLESRSWRWNRTTRTWTFTVAAMALTAVAALLVRDHTPAPTATMMLLLASGLLAVMGGAFGASEEDRRSLGTAVTLCGGVAALVAVQAAADMLAPEDWVRWAAGAAVIGFWLIVLGLTSPLGRGGVVGGLCAGGLALLWLVGNLAGMALPEVAAAMGIVVVVLLGVLPQLALTTSGLASLDDRAAAGRPVARRDAEGALAAAHRGLTGATVATAAAGAVAGWALAAIPTPWTVPLAALLAFILLSRSRIFPLVLQVLAAYAAAIVILAGLLATWIAHTPGPPYGPLAAAVAAAAVPLVGLAADPPEHVRVRLRRIVDRIEAVAVIAVIPVAIGVFGTYARLLATFA